MGGGVAETGTWVGGARSVAWGRIYAVRDTLGMVHTGARGPVGRAECEQGGTCLEGHLSRGTRGWGGTCRAVCELRALSGTHVCMQTEVWDGLPDGGGTCVRMGSTVLVTFYMFCHVLQSTSHERYKSQQELTYASRQTCCS